MRDARGELWTRRDGKVYYRQLPACDPAGRRYAVACWNELARRAQGRETPWDRLPAGPWEVTVP